MALADVQEYLKLLPAVKRSPLATLWLFYDAEADTLYIKGLDSLVIALYGPWGSGKSSIKNMMIEALRESEEGYPSIVEFNPWQWTGSEQLAEAFFHEIGVVLSRSDPSEEGKQRANQWRFSGRLLTLGVSIPRLLKTGFSMAGYPEANIALDPLIKGMEESARVAQEGSDALTSQAESRERNLSEIKQDLAARFEEYLC